MPRKDRNRDMDTSDLITHRQEIHRILLDWFDASGRDLPWRRRRSLYGTWISEIMLQQTTVAAVVPFWERFMARFPDVGALADAAEEDVLAMWSGLGYYRRARHLHAAAQRIEAQAGGRLPTDRAGWEALPGVGAYAAGAIASLGLGERCAALDANARRVLTRWAVGDPRRVGELTPARLRELAEALVPPSRPGAWNEAVMELGAVHCGARDPRCPSCPVADHCRAGRAGTAAAIPARVDRAAPTRVSLSQCVARRAGALLLVPPGTGPRVTASGWGAPVRADFSGLHRGLWGLPSTPWYASAADPAAFAHAAGRSWAGWTGPHLRGRPRLAGTVRHTITRFRLAIDVWAVDVEGGATAAELAGPGARWAEPGQESPTSIMVRKVVARESNPDG